MKDQEKLTKASILVKLKTIAASVSGRVKSVAVLYGGTSGEREISIASGMNVIRELKSEGFKVIAIDTGSNSFIHELLQNKPDVAFVALHGPGGEDGCIQGLLETLNIPFTHSGVEGSSLAMDKEISKILYKKEGLKTGDFITLLKTDKCKENDINKYIERIGLPCVVKPLCDGSSLGVSIPDDKNKLIQAIERGFEISDALMLEEFIEGTEITVAVVGNSLDELIALPVTEIVAKNEFYDYDAKYSEGGSTHIIPARISKEEEEACCKAAIEAHLLLKCAGLSRTDMIVDKNAVPWIIETNTVPGMTSTSLVPEAAQHFGLSAGELYRLLLHFATTRNNKILR